MKLSAFSELAYNNSDTILLSLLAVFVLIGLIFGASQAIGKIVGGVASAFLAPFLANMIMPTLASTDLYAMVLSWFGGNTTLGNWVVFLALFAVIAGVISLVFWLIVKLFKATPFTTRILGVVLAVAIWAIVLVGASFVFSFVGKNLGDSTPEWITVCSNTLSSSLITGKMIEWMQQLWQMFMN
jgi:hypothetical protein